MLVTLVVFTFRPSQPDPYTHQSFITFPTQVYLCVMCYGCLACSYLKHELGRDIWQGPPLAFHPATEEIKQLLRSFMQVRGVQEDLSLTHIFIKIINRGFLNFSITVLRGFIQRCLSVVACFWFHCSNVNLGWNLIRPPSVHLKMKLLNTFTLYDCDRFYLKSLSYSFRFKGTKQYFSTSRGRY